MVAQRRKHVRTKAEKILLLGGTTSMNVFVELLACPTCHGTGTDPKASRAHRYTTGGADERPPCPHAGAAARVTTRR